MNIQCVYSGDTLASKTYYVYDGFKCVEELDALNNSIVRQRHTWQPFELGLDVILATADAGGTSCFLHDANKNVMQTTDANGTLQASFTYAPFGENIGASRASVGFSSETFDATTDLNYYNYRYYAPGIGRWTRRDPLASDHLINIYSFVQNNVVFDFDVWGLYSLMDYWNAPANWLLTGYFFPTDEVLGIAYLEFINGISCWTDCMKHTHDCLVGKIITHAERITLPVAFVSSRIPKFRTVISNQKMTSLSRFIGYKLGIGQSPISPRSFSEEIGRWIGRSILAKASKVLVVSLSYFEVGVSWYCSIKCGNE